MRSSVLFPQRCGDEPDAFLLVERDGGAVERVVAP